VAGAPAKRRVIVPEPRTIDIGNPVDDRRMPARYVPMLGTSAEMVAADVSRNVTPLAATALTGAGTTPAANVDVATAGLSDLRTPAQTTVLTKITTIAASARRCRFANSKPSPFPATNS
jgi:hypothetical protein